MLLDTEGKGHYVGCNLSVHHRQGSWWGEGNDMIWIDDDFQADGSTSWPPSLHGTGTEDYFESPAGARAMGMSRQCTMSVLTAWPQWIWPQNGPSGSCW